MQLEEVEEEGRAMEPGQGKRQGEPWEAGWTRTMTNLMELESPNPSWRRNGVKTEALELKYAKLPPIAFEAWCIDAMSPPLFKALLIVRGERVPID
jgi:hypothetical protein